MDTAVKVTVVYYSATGHVADIAREIADTAEKAGAEVRLRRVAEPAPWETVESQPAWAADADATAGIPLAAVEDIVWADAVLMGSPTRFGNIAAQLKQFLDTLGGAWKKGELADKIYSGFTSTGSPHGGNESTLLALMHSFHHFGGIVVAPGFTHPDKFIDGNPYGHRALVGPMGVGMLHEIFAHGSTRGKTPRIGGPGWSPSRGLAMLSEDRSSLPEET